MNHVPDDFCFVDQPGCQHDRCLRVRDGNRTCHAGHPLDDDGMCKICDDVTAALAKILLNKMPAGQKIMRKQYKRSVDNRMRDYGSIDWDKKAIKINKTMSRTIPGGVLDTIVHEETHRRRPQLSEKAVKKQTTRTIERMPASTKSRHYRRYREGMG